MFLTVFDVSSYTYNTNIYANVNQNDRNIYDMTSYRWFGARPLQLQRQFVGSIYLHIVLDVATIEWKSFHRPRCRGRNPHWNGKINPGIEKSTPTYIKSKSCPRVHISWDVTRVPKTHYSHVIWYDGVLNHQRLDCFLERLFGRRSKETSKLCVTGHCEGNSSVSGEFPTQKASNAENVSIWWRHHF